MSALTEDKLNLKRIVIIVMVNQHNERYPDSVYRKVIDAYDRKKAIIEELEADGAIHGVDFTVNFWKLPLE